MKKHILGFAIFGLIIGFSIGIYKLVTVLEELRDVEIISEPLPIESSEIKSAEEKFFTISQVTVYPNKKDENIEVELTFNCKTKWCQGGVHVGIQLYFFIINDHETKYLGNEFLVFKPNSQESHIYNLSWSNPSINPFWLKELKPNDNLYVTLEKRANKVTETVEDRPNTDLSFAKPVLISWANQK